MSQVKTEKDLIQVRKLPVKGELHTLKKELSARSHLVPNAEICILRMDKAEELSVIQLLILFECDRTLAWTKSVFSVYSNTESTCWQRSCSAHSDPHYAKDI